MSLSTHVLDLVTGRPAVGMRVTLEHAAAVQFKGQTDEGGRCPDLSALTLGPAVYRLRFGVADYFRGQGHELPTPPFIEDVTIEFGIAEPAGHYHVPLLVTPFAYSTYRGS